MNNPKIDSWLNEKPNLDRSVHLSVIIPAYNEERRLPPTLIEIIDYLDQQQYTYEIIVVDDGSKDQTSVMVNRFEKIKPQVRLIRLAKNRGKGHAVKTGALNAQGEYIIYNDADGSTPIQEVEKLFSAIKNSSVQIAFGSRAKKDDSTKINAHIHRILIGRTFNFFVTLLLVSGIKDSQCGFKMFTKESAFKIFSKQTIDGFNFDIELLYLAKKIGYQYAEIPVNWHSVPGSKVNLIKDSIKMFFSLFVIKYRHRNLQREIA